jgi:Putative zinc-finger
MTCEEAQELITALTDRQLRDRDRVLLDMHLKECAPCRLVFEQEQALKRAVRAAGDALQAPARLRDRILSDSRIFPDKTRTAWAWQDYLWPQSYLVRPALVVVLLLIITVPILYRMDYRSQPVALAALETYDLFARGELPVHRQHSADEIVGELTRAVGGHFHPMGYDLTAMNLRPVAGLVREIEGHKILVAIYQGPGGSLFCYTFLGSEKDAPPGAARFFDSEKKMNFYAFSHGKVNAVLHREDDIICILASEMPMEELLALARSKARPS